MAVDVYWQMQNLRLAEQLMEGIARRDRALWEVGRVVARVQASSMGAKHLDDTFPYRLPWDNEDNAEFERMSDDERRQQMEQCLPELQKAMLQAIKNQTQDGKENSQN